MNEMLKFENGTWIMNNFFLVELLKNTANLALDTLPKKKTDREKATQCLAMLQVEFLHKTIVVADELFTAKAVIPSKRSKLKLVKPKV